MQSSSWFCFIYSFWLFLRCTWIKITTRVIRSFITIGFWNFSKFPFSFFLFLFSIFLIFNLFECRANSFIYSFVEQFLEIHFHKNNYRGKGYTFRKNWLNFSGLYTPLTWGVGYIIRARLAILKERRQANGLQKQLVAMSSLLALNIELWLTR